MEKFIHTKLEKHPLRDCWMVVNVSLPFIPPYFGTKKECESARVFAERNAAKYPANQVR